MSPNKKEILDNPKHTGIVNQVFPVAEKDG